MRSLTRLFNAVLLVALASTAARAQVNAGRLAPQSSVPFTLTKVATFNLPWRIAFLPDGRMLVTEKVGPIWVVTQHGEKTPVSNVPKVVARGQGGMLGIFLSPHYATDHDVYLTYAEPGEAVRARRVSRSRVHGWFSAAGRRVSKGCR